MNELKLYIKNKLKEYGILVETLKKGEFSRFSWSALDHDLQVIIKERNPTIFDIGANSGQSVDKFKSIFPTSVIYSFEPLEEYYILLKETSNKHSNVYCEQIALGNEEKVVTINRNQKAVLSSILEISDNPANRFSEKKTIAKYEVQQTTVDKYVRRKGIERIDLLKIDVQGYDLEVLKGAPKSLQQIVDYVLIEINMISMYEGQPNYLDIISFLNHQNFHLIDFYEISRSKLAGREGTIDWCNGLFKKTT